MPFSNWASRAKFCLCILSVVPFAFVNETCGQPIPFPVDVGSALGYFDPTRNLGSAPATAQRQLEVGGAVGSSVANVGSQAAFSASQKRYKDFLDLESAEDNQGSLFSEPAWTLGKGNHSVGLGYSWFHFTEFNGDPLDELFDFSYSDPFLTAVEDTHFSLDAHVWTLSYGKGITDDLDVYFVLPFIRLEGAGQIAGEISSEAFPDLNTGPYSDSYDHNDMGIGDLMLRVKYAVCQDEDSVFSIGGDLVFPTGDEDEYLGGGNMGYRVRALYSKKFGNFYPTVEVGYFYTPLDGNIQALPVEGIVIPSLNEHDFDQFEYRVGIPYACNEKVTLSLEWIGSHSKLFDQNDIGFSGRFDMGHLKEGLVLDAGVRVPIDDDGLRTDLTPFVAMEYRF